jgi:hypothetical protein
VAQVGGNQPLEERDELMAPLRRQIERELLDGDDAIPARIVRAEHRTQGAGANLMKNPERTEGVRWRSARSFRVQ